ncbi:hypothetical protein [Hyphomicrobium sp.]|uniref:hypothetical protein n=1 Tax=Hyphomicrobium sp. TaxID=82 RepID=UPI002D7782D2|nr:hypothetical protein [Hyphomicrobium sp.]HET6391035.1 hypothetical protein [Hyphomicrobium sp.]
MAIGRVASEWAHLEHTLDLIIWDLAGWKLNMHQSVLACITAQIMGVGPRCKVIQALGELRELDDSVLKPARTLMSDAYPVADWRARWVHDPWYIDANSDAVGQFRAMPNADRRYGIKDIDLDDVTKTIKEIGALQERASALRNSVLAALGAYT